MKKSKNELLQNENSDGASPFRSVSHKGYSENTPLRYSVDDKNSGFSDSLDFSQNAQSPNEPNQHENQGSKTFRSRIIQNEKSNLLKVHESGP